MNGARLDSVCKYICEKSDWTISNLRLQKLLYLAQMFYMGRHSGTRLVDTNFQAWDYGPVAPELYHKVKDFGARSINQSYLNFWEEEVPTFPDARKFKDDDIRKKTIDDICDNFLSWTPGQLIGATHWEKGAWAKYYKPGMHGIMIPDNDILEEYRERQK